MQGQTKQLPMLTVKSRPSAAASADEDGSSKATSRPSEVQERRQRQKAAFMEARFWLTKDTFYLALLLILLVQSAWWFSRDRDALEENSKHWRAKSVMSVRKTVRVPSPSPSRECPAPSSSCSSCSSSSVPDWSHPSAFGRRQTSWRNSNLE